MSSRRSSFSSPLLIDAFVFCYPCACENERRGKERDENQSENNEKEGNPDEKKGPKQSCHDTLFSRSVRSWPCCVIHKSAPASPRGPRSTTEIVKFPFVGFIARLDVNSLANDLLKQCVLR